MPCDLGSIRYYEQLEDVLRIYEVDDYGGPSFLVKDLSRLEPRNIAQYLANAAHDLLRMTYNCACGYGTDFWEDALMHCDLYICGSCNKATEKWEGWDYLCRECDKDANPDYHQRNPLYYGR